MQAADANAKVGMSQRDGFRSDFGEASLTTPDSGSCIRFSSSRSTETASAMAGSTSIMFSMISRSATEAVPSAYAPMMASVTSGSSRV